MATKVTKPAAKTVKKAAPKAAAAPVEKKVAKVAASLTASVVDTNGKAAGSVELPEALFGAKVNKQLMAQAVRIYLANQRSGTAATKTRGMVEGSTRKIYKQKGTGRARHGGIRAPIFVGGGVVFGAMPRDYSMQFPKKMKAAALASALTQCYKEGCMTFVDGFEKLPAKTKDVAKSMKTLEANKSVLFVVATDAPQVARSSRNIEGIDVMPVVNLHPYALLAHKKIVVMKSAVAQAIERFV
jgi:large subunit ribosomal protein L4